MTDIKIQAAIHSPKVDSVRPQSASSPAARQISSFESQLSKASAMDPERMQDLIDKVDEFVKSLSTKVSFSVDDQTGKRIIIVSEKETGKIIRQIPAEEMLKLAAKMEEIGGIIFNGRV